MPILIEINAVGAGLRDARHCVWEVGMTVQEMTVVIFLASTFAVFAIMLAFASWDETRRTRKLDK